MLALHLIASHRVAWYGQPLRLMQCMHAGWSHVCFEHHSAPAGTGARFEPWCQLSAGKNRCGTLTPGVQASRGGRRGEDEGIAAVVLACYIYHSQQRGSVFFHGGGGGGGKGGEGG